MAKTDKDADREAEINQAKMRTRGPAKPLKSLRLVAMVASPPNQQRADVAVVGMGLADSRQKAQALILAGPVWRATARSTRQGRSTAPHRLRLRGEPIPFVSRGGLKLAKALEVFDVDPTDRVAVDVELHRRVHDCLLQAGAARVHCVDVGCATGLESRFGRTGSGS